MTSADCHARRGKIQVAWAAILAVSIVFVYIVLSMLYESWFIPFAVLLSVPSGMVGSFLFVRLFGLEKSWLKKATVIKCM